MGYGDIVVATDLGRLVTALMILSGFAIIAVPTGIVAADFSRVEAMIDETTDACPGCGVHGHLVDASFCRRCGHSLTWSNSTVAPAISPSAAGRETYRVISPSKTPPPDKS